MVYTSLLRTSQVLGYRTRFLSFCELKEFIRWTQVNWLCFFGGGGFFVNVQNLNIDTKFPSYWLWHLLHCVITWTSGQTLITCISFWIREWVNEYSTHKMFGRDVNIQMIDKWWQFNWKINKYLKFKSRSSTNILCLTWFLQRGWFDLQPYNSTDASEGMGLSL